MEVLKRSNAASAALVDDAVRYILEHLEIDFFFPTYFSNQTIISYYAANLQG